MEDIAVMLKKRLEISDALDREHGAMWLQLTKVQMTNSENSTTELFERQVKWQDEENSARCDALSDAEKSIENALQKTALIHGTANRGISVLCDAVTYTEGEVLAICNRVKAAKNKRDDAMASIMRKVTMQKSVLDGLGESVLMTNQHPSGMDKLSAMLSKLKIADDAKITSLKENIEGSTLQIKSKASAHDEVRCSIDSSKLQTKELYQALQETRTLLRFKETMLAESSAKLEKLKAKSLENSNKVVEERNYVREFCDRYDAFEKQLSELPGAVKIASEKLTHLCSYFSTKELDFTSYLSKQEEEIAAKKSNMSQEVLKLKGQVAQGQQDSGRLNCQLESLRKRIVQFDNYDERKDRDEIECQAILQERSDILDGLEPEIEKYSTEIAAMEAMEKDSTNAQSIGLMWNELDAYAEVKKEKKHALWAHSSGIEYKLTLAQHKIASIQEVYSKNKAELVDLVAKLKDVQAQINAFTTLRTPSKPVEAPTKASARKSQTAGRRLSGRQNDPDSDNDFSSCVREVVGLQSFSPATISFKERTKSESAAPQTSTKSTVPVDNNRNVTKAVQHTLDSSAKQLSFTEPRGSFKSSISERDDSVIFLSEKINTDESPAYGNMVTKRFPNDIFLKKSPSLDCNDSISAEVSTFNPTDDDQSIWSPVSPSYGSKQNDMDTTAETDLDQSVW
ncbi:hypothetical protein KIN20_021905 [Parelaphostrongylus tenuis]|uniref:Uncharacterized protein n=1 Tax=Parelaphostrongylus tenuis TaxID=148309 RepID=A0AAD5MTB1_PARTN|nr:hypothetical protein KIN20_021905 [Parelaphostrongylus tenuis]